MRKTVLVAFVLLSCLVMVQGIATPTARRVGHPRDHDRTRSRSGHQRRRGSQFSTTGLGALKVGHSGGQITGVRVFNDQRPINQGTTGFFIPPRGLFGAAASGVLPFLSQASVPDIQAGLGFRSNIGWFNPNLTAAGATFVARRASDGSVLGSVSVTINGLSQVQQAVFSLISGVAAADQV